MFKNYFSKTFLKKVLLNFAFERAWPRCQCLVTAPDGAEGADRTCRNGHGRFGVLRTCRRRRSRSVIVRGPSEGVRTTNGNTITCTNSHTAVEKRRSRRESVVGDGVVKEKLSCGQWEERVAISFRGINYNASIVVVNNREAVSKSCRARTEIEFNVLPTHVLGNGRPAGRTRGRTRVISVPGVCVVTADSISGNAITDRYCPCVENRIGK